MKIILDNIIFHLQKSGGVSVYWQELAKRFNDLHDDVVFYEQAQNCDNLCRKELCLDSIEKEKHSTLCISMKRYLPFLTKVREKSIFHSSYYRFSLSKKVINITTVHDFITEKFDKRPSKWIHYYQKKIALERSEGIICISECTKKDLLQFHPQLINKNIVVIYNGVSNDFYFDVRKKNLKDVDERFEALETDKFILYVGHRTSYKNFDMAVEAMSIVKDDFLFVIVGEPLLDKEKKILDKYLKNRFFVYSSLGNSKLNALYNNAFALLYPSSYEGFGIPVVEALKAQCNVIAANTSSIPEVGGDAAVLLDDINAKSITETIINLRTNEAWRNELKRKGVIHAEKFSWDITFKRHLEFYEENFEFIDK